MLLDRLLFADKTPLMMKRALDFQSQRQLLVSSNISNMDTPGYKAQDVDFQSALKEAVGGGDDLKMKRTQSGHFGPGKDNLKMLQPDVYEEPDAARSNGNNVNVDKEMTKLAENQIAYSATIQLLQKRGSTIRAAIAETPQG